MATGQPIVNGRHQYEYVYRPTRRRPDRSALMPSRDNNAINVSIPSVIVSSKWRVQSDHPPVVPATDSDSSNSKPLPRLRQVLMLTRCEIEVWSLHKFLKRPTSSLAAHAATPSIRGRLHARLVIVLARHQARFTADRPQPGPRPRPTSPIRQLFPVILRALVERMHPPMACARLKSVQIVRQVSNARPSQERSTNWIRQKRMGAGGSLRSPRSAKISTLRLRTRNATTS